MKLPVCLLVPLVTIAALNLTDSNDHGAFILQHEKPGNITIIGVFDGVVGSKCHLRSSKALVEMASAIWIVEALNKYEYLRGLTIGLRAYENCQRSPFYHDYLQKMREKSGTDEPTHNIGVSTTFAINENSKSFGKVPSYVTQVRHLGNEVILVDLVVQLLVNLQWSVVESVYARTDDVLNLFAEKATSEGIYTYNQIVIDESMLGSSANATESDRTKVIIIITKFEEIASLIGTNKTEINQNESIKVILAPIDSLFEPFKGLPRDTLIVWPVMGNGDVLRQFVKGNERHRDFFNHREPTKSPLFLGVAVAIMNLLRPFREIQKEYCDGRSGKTVPRSSCPEIIEFLDFLEENKTNSPTLVKTEHISSDDIFNVFDTLKLDRNSNAEMFLYLTSLLSTATAMGSEDVAIFQLFNMKTKSFHPVLLKINVHLFNDGENIGEPERKIIEIDLGENSGKMSDMKNSKVKLFPLKKEMEDRNQYSIDTAFNFSLSESVDLHEKNESLSAVQGRNDSSEDMDAVWRNSTWVIANTCLGFMGLLSILFIVVFILRRICNESSLEGSPIFIIFLIFAASFVFASSLCYHFDPLPNTTRFICTCRALAPPLVYSILFSLMLSRSLLLAFSETQNGFVSHVNGYLQSVVFLCLLGIQISLTSQAWIYEQVPADDSTCCHVHASKKIIVSLFYDYILVGLLLSAGPFIIHLKRNYKEGLFLSISSLFVALAWMSWIGCYYLLPPEYNDAAVAIGLNSTGFVLVIFSFIPRVWLTIAAIVRGRSSTCLTSQNRDALPEVLDVHYKASDLPLDGNVCETFNVGVLNPNFIQ